MSFLPVLNGERTAVVTVSFEGGVDSVSTTVSGTGSYGSVTGTNTDFGFLYRNESLTQTVTLTNDAVDEAFPLVDLPITTLSISSSSCNFVLIDDSSGSDEEVASLEINDALAVGGTLNFKTKFNPTASAPSTVNCTASVSVGLAVQNDFPIGQNHTLSLSGSVRNEPLAKLQVQNSDGSWSQMNGFDFGNVYNNDDAGDDATVSMRIINEDAAGYGGDLTVSKLCFKETGSSTECTADPAAGAFDVVSRITDDVVLAAGESHGFTLQFNPDWSNSSGETAHARDLRYETDDPVLGSGNHEIAGNTVRPKLWANVTAAGGGPIDAQAFIDYDQRATAANFSAVDVWGSASKDVHLHNFGGSVSGSFPNRTYGTWGDLEIESIEREGGEGAFTLSGTHRRCFIYKSDYSGTANDDYYLGKTASGSAICYYTQTWPASIGEIGYYNMYNDTYAYRSTINFQPSAVQSYSAI